MRRQHIPPLSGIPWCQCGQIIVGNPPHLQQASLPLQRGTNYRLLSDGVYSWRSELSFRVVFIPCIPCYHHPYRFCVYCGFADACVLASGVLPQCAFLFARGCEMYYAVQFWPFAQRSVRWVLLHSLILLEHAQTRQGCKLPRLGFRQPWLLLVMTAVSEETSTPLPSPPLVIDPLSNYSVIIFTVSSPYHGLITFAYFEP